MGYLWWLGIDLFIVLFFLHVLNLSGNNVGWRTVIETWLITSLASPIVGFGVGYIVEEYIVQSHAEGMAGYVYLGYAIGVVVVHIFGIRRGLQRVKIK